MEYERLNVHLSTPRRFCEVNNHDTDSTSCKPFSCHSYENTGDTYRLFPLWNSPLRCSSIPCIFNGFRTLCTQWSAATLVFSDASGLFPLQWGCIPPLKTQCLPPTSLSQIGDSTQLGTWFSLFTIHQSRVTSHCPHNIQQCRGGRSWVTLCPCPSFQIAGRASVWEG
jgi:hypothetical protein